MSTEQVDLAHPAPALLLDPQRGARHERLRCPVRHDWFLDPAASEPEPGSWGVLVSSNGGKQVRWLCPQCGRRSSSSIGHAQVREFDVKVRDLPVILDNRP